MPDTILVVDDEPDVEFIIRQRFRRRIRKDELQFVFAGDGVEALEKLQDIEAIDIVLSDINMPRMDGLTLLRNLSEQKRLLKAIVVTAYGDMENIRQAMNWGAFDFLTKPIDLNDLEITLDNARKSVAEEKRAIHAREAFGRYVSDAVARKLLQEGEIKLGGEKVRATMLMSDLRGFSTISENLSPEHVVDVLNIYLGKMADVISEYQGIINEFIGDAIFAIFGAPIAQEADADRAVACALAMQMAMTEVNHELAQRGFPRLEMGIGINTGEVVVGNIGSLKRLKYGVVGSHVNLTSRIETYTVGGQVLISENTLHDLSADVQIGRHMEVATKGFSDPICIYEVEGMGAPYNVELPTPDAALFPLATHVPVQFCTLDGKHMVGNMMPAHLTALSSTGATLASSERISELANLKIIPSLPQDPSESLGDLYAKVIGQEPDGSFLLRFTAVPEDVASAFAAMLA